MTLLETYPPEIQDAYPQWLMFETYRKEKVKRPRISLEDILTLVCDYYRVEQKDVLSKNRYRNLVEARQIAMYLMREHSLITHKAIGEFFNRDHTTVIYAVQTVRGFIDIQDADTVNDLAHLESKISLQIAGGRAV